MSLKKPTLGKHIWSLMTPEHLFLGLDLEHLWSAPYTRSYGGKYYDRLTISARYELKSGKLEIFFAKRAVAQTELWNWIHQSSSEFTGEKQGIYVRPSEADPLTKRILSAIRRHLVSEKHPKNTVITEHLRMPKGILQHKNGILYFGYKGKVTQTHPLEKLHRIVLDALAAVKRAWHWQPNNLKIFSHTSGNGMGLAFQPGKGVHALSLHTRLLRGYDADSIYRVLLHEFCHHHREEKWPRTLHKLVSYHDEKFCEELAKVDSIVRGSGNCRTFTDEQWEQSAAVIQKQKREKTISWKPQNGYLVLRRIKGGTLKLDWVPRESGAFRKKIYNVGFDSLKELLSHFTYNQIQKVEVVNQLPEYSPFYKSLGSQTNLALLMEFLTTAYPSYHFEKLREVLK